MCGPISKTTKKKFFAISICSLISFELFIDLVKTIDRISLQEAVSGKNIEHHASSVSKLIQLNLLYLNFYLHVWF